MKYQKDKSAISYRTSFFVLGQPPGRERLINSSLEFSKVLVTQVITKPGIILIMHCQN